ncbi:39S ribosomal protein L44, mitochondrial-like isoform X1 [Mytilus californianus]|uniref:39S ribosomal protein L44, mitochondrial-like isoform X1 n=1 Tax=Mytilus californianus TaxID=6549 RepID=UPI002247A2D7|nr:39S ribosomal protein L44, mitochondrial-like isoform X1 [Mytilus californianus]
MAASCRLISHCRILSRFCNNSGISPHLTCLQGCMVRRGLNNSRKYQPLLRELYKRRIKAGPEPELHPSESGCWNYNSEIYAFGKRYGEDFDESFLRKAFITSDYRQAEEESRRQLGIDLESVPVGVVDNSELAQKGEQIASRYIKAYLRHSYPMMLEEGIQAVHDYLMDDQMIYYIASNFGLTDLIMSPNYPPEDHMYCTAFKAVIGALAESQNEERAGLFVRDFVASQLAGKNLMEIWDVKNPMGLLSSALSMQGRGPPEPRLLWQSASATMLSLYHVGIYSDKQLIGRSPGETLPIAEEMAAKDALSKLMNISLAAKPLQFGEKSESWKFDYNQRNQSANDLLQTPTNI